MAPEKASIFYVEDDEDSFAVTNEFLEMSGHHVTVKATSLKDALAKIPMLTENGVNVAIVDGNLSFGDESGQDGERVALEIKKHNKSITVIGHALSKPINNADVNSTKHEGSMSLAEVVTNS